MRRTGVAAALAAVLAVALAGCGAPDGTDGDLVNGWSAMVPATGFVPPVEACHAAGFSRVQARSAYEQVDCDEPHRTETIAVAAFTGEAAAAAAPPATGTPASQGAYGDCDAQAQAFAGGDWRTARLWLGVVQ